VAALAHDLARLIGALHGGLQALSKRARVLSTGPGPVNQATNQGTALDFALR
jgi:hypothetical protein